MRPPYLPHAQRPRISVPGITPLAALPAASPKRAQDAAACEDNLLRRLEALRAAFENPIPLARRLLRLRTAPGAPRVTLAYASPPGLAARPLASAGQDIYRRVNDAAELAELSPLDSS